jgi:hypothetical protein
MFSLQECRMANWESAGGCHRLWEDGVLIGQIQELSFLWELKIPGVAYQRGRERLAWRAFLRTNRAYEFARRRSVERPRGWSGPEPR